MMLEMDAMSEGGHAEGQGVCAGQTGAVENACSAQSFARDPGFFRRRKKGRLSPVAAPALEAGVVDTHCHLHLLDDPAWELDRCAFHGVTFLGVVTDPTEDGARVFEGLDTWLENAPLTARITCGVHPHNASRYDETVEADLLELLANPRVSALGEIGLDYHYDFSPREDQRRVFRRQIQLAKRAGLPIALHVREAHAEALAILREEGVPAAGVLLHCCALDAAALRPWVEVGCYIAYGGQLTFKKFDGARAAARLVPVERLLTETDAPYLAPEPLRGSPCTPSHVVFTAACLAQVRGAAPGEERARLLSQVEENARRLLDRPPTPWQRQAAQDASKCMRESGLVEPSERQGCGARTAAAVCAGRSGTVAGGISFGQTGEVCS